MSIASQLRHFIRSGIHSIGELEIHSDLYGYTYALFHWQDAELATEPALGGLDHY